MVFESVGQYLLFTRDANEYYTRLLTKAAQKSRLSKPEGDVLLFFANSPHLDTARDACEYRGFSKAYVSKAVEGLCIRGLLRMEPDTQDRRVQHLRLSPISQEVVELLRQAQQEFFDDLTAGMTLEESQLIWNIMERMRKNIQKANG